jgi:hypothetical protein
MRKPVVKILLWIFISTLVTYTSLPASELTVKAEASEYTETSTYKDVMTFLFEAQKRSDYIRVSTLATSTEGRMIPLAIISKEKIKNPKELRLSGKPAVLIMANIHAGEVEGKEATQMLIREFVQKVPKTVALLENQVVLIVPIFNTDGNDKMAQNNRRDNGPELAGLRPNGQSLDLNRDYLKLETPEVNGLVRLFNQWDPVLIVDMHTTNGSYHREPVTYTTQVNPNIDRDLSQYMWKKMFPAVADTLKKEYGYDSVPYGNFVDRTKPEMGWRNHAYAAMYGNNYAGLRNRFTILDENYAHADFKTRVLGSFGFIKSILQYTSTHINEMKKMIAAADKKTMSGYFKEHFALEYKTEKLFDLTLKSYEFQLEKIKPEDRDKYPPWIRDYIVKKTDTFKDYRLPYFCKAVPTRTLPLPEAYVIPPFNDEIIAKLKLHGIAVERVRTDVKYTVEIFNTKEIKPANRIYQGHISLKLGGSYETKEITIPANSYFVSMKQPLARLIPILLEPESEDSLAAWGFLNRQLVRQWSRRANPYPIYRIPELTAPIERYQD